MISLLLVLASLIPLQGAPREIFNAPVDDTYNLRAAVAQSEIAPGRCCSSRLRVLLVERANANRYWEIASISDPYEIDYTIQRMDRSSIVIERKDPDYGISQGSLKLFFDVASKRLLKQIEFKPIDAMASVRSEEAKRVGLDPVWFAQIQKELAQDGSPDEDHPLPPAMQGQALPQSTYREFARARPDMVRNGLDEQRANIEEKVGPYQQVGNRIWFGKTFYDGEGHTGVGAIGYFNTDQKKFTFLRIPEVIGVSISAILVEDAVLWAGTEVRPEGESYSKGLLRYDINTSKTQTYPIENVIRSIHRSGDALLMSTANGIYVLRNNGQLLRHRASPAIDGTFVLDTEVLK
jgi:hypothetical protein